MFNLASLWLHYCVHKWLQFKGGCECKIKPDTFFVAVLNDFIQTSKSLSVYCILILANGTVTGAVYLKNMILHHWVSSGDGTAAEFVIHDSDKNVIRDNIVEAVILSENLIRSVFCKVKQETLQCEAQQACPSWDIMVCTVYLKEIGPYATDFGIFASLILTWPKCSGSATLRTL